MAGVTPEGKRASTSCARLVWIRTWALLTACNLDKYRLDKLPTHASNMPTLSALVIRSLGLLRRQSWPLANRIALTPRAASKALPEARGEVRETPQRPSRNPTRGFSMLTGRFQPQRYETIIGKYEVSIFTVRCKDGEQRKVFLVPLAFRGLRYSMYEVCPAAGS